MYIKSIKAKNFKNFKELNLELNSLNLLVGANASGKSNFIQLLKFIKDLSQFGFENSISLQGDKEFFKNLTGNTENTFIEVEFINNSESANIVSLTYSIEIEYLDKVILKNEKVKFKTNVNTFYINRSNDKVEIKSENELNTYIIPNDLIIRKLECGQCIPQVIDNIIDSDIFKIKIFDVDSKKENLPSTTNDLIELRENGENLSIVLRNIFRSNDDKTAFINLVQQALPFVKDINIENYFNENLVLNLQESYYKDKFLPSAVLSDGTIIVFCLVLAMFFDNSNIKVFEEPERALHPYLISRIIALFYDASNYNQIFLTTHNPEMLKCVRLEDIFLLNRSDRGETEIRPVKSYESLDVFLQNNLGIDEIISCSLLT